MSLKLIVTNRGVLDAKYGAAGLAALDTAVQDLIDADAARGVDSEVVNLDLDPNSAKQNKEEIDAIYADRRPDYLMLLGSVDVIPHQELTNPTYRPGVDDDKLVPSDLPYACDAPYSRQISDFDGPTRVVGRLPDVTGVTDAGYLTRLLQTAAAWTARPADDYRSYFCVSAQDWQSVTQASLEWIFGNSTALGTCPALGPQWTRQQLSGLLHFVNCHGDFSSPRYFGSDPFPDAMDAGLLAAQGLIQGGTVAVAECCYGGELYDPAPVGGQMGIANTYLGEGAYAFFASSSVAYGPEVGSAGAGLICQNFAYYILEGASTGRAALQARQDFIEASPLLSPIDLKTLAQFNLLGDPSIHPAQSTNAAGLTAVPRTAAARDAAAPLGEAEVKRIAGRSLRRDRLSKIGEMLGKVTPFSAAKATGVTPANLRRLVLGALAGSGVLGGAVAGAATALKWASFPVRRPRGAKLFASAKFWETLPKVVHFATGLLDAKPKKIRRRVALVAYDEDGTLAVRRFLGR